jgi:hypothetical protein
MRFFLQVVATKHRVHASSDARATVQASLVIGLEMVSTSHRVDSGASQAGAADLLDLGDRKTLLVVMDGLDSAAYGTTLERGRDDVLALDSEDVEAVSDPMGCDIGQHNDESNHGNEVRDACACGIGDGTLDRREDGSSRHAHDEDTGTAAGVSAKVGSSKREDAGVHGCHEEEYDDDAGDTGGPVTVRDICGESDADDAVDHQHEIAFEKHGDTSSNKAADGEDQEAVRQQA